MEATQLFTDLYHAQSDAVFRYCYIRVSDVDQAQDITQQAFMRVWDVFVKDAVTAEDIQNPRALVFKIATNLIIDWYRKKKSVSLDALLETENNEYILQLHDASHEQMEIASEGSLLLNQVKKIDNIYQQVVYLRYVEDMSPKEIAQITGLAVNVVSVRIHRGIEELKKIYEPQP